MPKVFIEVTGAGMLTAVYAARGVEVFTLNPTEKQDAKPVVTEPLDILEIEDEPKVFIYGNPADGFSFVGPFDNQSHAEIYAIGESNTDWWFAPLEWPAEEG